MEREQEKAKKEKKKTISKQELDKYNFYHPYMWKRRLSKQVVDRFCIGYDKDTDCITFPVWDEHGDIVMITRRSVNTKKFNIPSDSKKPVYLLNFADTNKPVYVCESQINALTLWGWGYQAVALFGTGSQEQYSILKKSGIRNYVLCLDGDVAGDNGITRFKKNLENYATIQVKEMPRDGRDVNDLEKEEFDLIKCE